MRERASLIITGILLVLSLSMGVFAAHAAIIALRSFQKERVLTQQGDVATIRPWMTVPYISKVYQVPAPYLYQDLKLPGERQAPHVTLHALATRTKQPVDTVIHKVQVAILTYRKAHPTPYPSSHKKLKTKPGEGTF